jgi:hypothetical protein
MPGVVFKVRAENVEQAVKKLMTEMRAAMAELQKQKDNQGTFTSFPISRGRPAVLACCHASAATGGVSGGSGTERHPFHPTFNALEPYKRSLGCRRLPSRWHTRFRVGRDQSRPAWLSKSLPRNPRVVTVMIGIQLVASREGQHTRDWPDTRRIREL